MLWNMIEEHQSWQSNAPPHMKKDTNIMRKRQTDRPFYNI